MQVKSINISLFKGSFTIPNLAKNQSKLEGFATLLEIVLNLDYHESLEEENVINMGKGTLPSILLCKNEMVEMALPIDWRN